MIFIEPIAFEDALKIALDGKLLPTDLGSADIAEWSAELKRRSVFTSRGTSAGFLQTIQDTVQDLASGKINQAKGRELLKESLDMLDYSAEHGFPGDLEVGVPPAEEGSLQDLAGEDRLNLILDTQAAQVANFGYFTQGQTPFALHAWPCWELIRVSPRTVPRGERTVKGVIVPDPDNAWPARWEKVGGTLHDGRMVARKDDSLWDVLGSSELFSDGLDQPYPPFAFNSGMGFRQVDREESIALGVIGANDQVGGQKRSLNEGLKMSIKRFSPEFLKALEADLDAEVKAGELRLKASLERAAANEEISAFLLDLMIDAANVWDPAKHPRGPDGKFLGTGSTKHPMDLGKTVSRARQMLDADLQAAGLDTDHGPQSPDRIAEKLRERLKVKKPVSVSTKLTKISGGSAADRAQVVKDTQALFDMLPPKVARQLSALKIRIVNRPNAKYAGFSAESHAGAPAVIVLNRGVHDGLTRQTVWHEMGHYVQNEGPASYRAAVQSHFQRRTLGEATQNTGGYDFKRDQLFSNYEGQIYPREHSEGEGSEIPSTRFEHLSSGRAGFYPKAGIINSARYKETMGVALSIFYHGRRR